MSKEASERLSMLWQYMPFRCEWENNVQSCVQDFTGYEIRQIPVVLKPLDDKYKGELHKELTVSFNKQGIITGVRTSIGNNSYLALLSGGKANLDMRMRREILKYLEDCRSYYTEKNMNAIANILGFRSFDVKKSITENSKTPVMVSLKKNECSVKDKQEYLSNLNKYFQQDGCIVAKISDIELMRHVWNPYFMALILDYSCLVVMESCKVQLVATISFCGILQRKLIQRYILVFCFLKKMSSCLQRISSFLIINIE